MKVEVIDPKQLTYSDLDTGDIYRYPNANSRTFMKVYVPDELKEVCLETGVLLPVDNFDAQVIRYKAKIKLY